MGSEVPGWLRVLVLLGALAVTAVVVTLARAEVDGLPLAPLVAAGAVVVVAALWPLLPGLVGRLVTVGWVLAVGGGVLLWAGPVAALALVGAATSVALFAAGVSRRPLLAEAARLLALGASVVVAHALHWACGLVAEPGAAVATLEPGGAPASTGAALLSAAALLLLVGALLDTVARVGVRSLTDRTTLPAALRAEGVGTAVAAGHLLSAPLMALSLAHAPLLLLPLVLLLTAAEALGWVGTASRREALRDPLTGLSNRRDLERHASRAVARATTAPRPRPGPRRGLGRDRRRPCALLLVDLDGFKRVNDEEGHDVGDDLLREVGRRLRDVAGRECLVARVGGDEFAVLLPRARSRAAVERLAEDVRRVLVHDTHDPDAHSQGACPGSVGAALAPDHGHDVTTLLRAADEAMYAAKARDGVAVYDPGMGTRSEGRRELVLSLRRALDERSLDLVYQPKVSLDHGGVVGVEALLRWTDADRGPVPPDSFIPLAEGAGLIGRLTTVVLELVLDQCASWLRDGDRVPVAVNVSLRDLEDPGFAERTARAMAAAGVPSSLLTLEVTERVLAGDLSSVGETMERLRRLGVRLSLDDFGTGWSSLLLLRRLRVDELKLDREFVQGVAEHPDDEVVVRTVLGLARDLGLATVAEGVEDRRTLEVLAAMGCDVAQGWHTGRPVPGTVVPSLLASRPPQPRPAPTARPGLVPRPLGDGALRLTS